MLVRRETLREITDVSQEGDITDVSQEGDITDVIQEEDITGHYGCQSGGRHYGALRMLILCQLCMKIAILKIMNLLTVWTTSSQKLTYQLH